MRRLIASIVCAALLLVAHVAESSNDFYSHGSFPSTGSALSSAAMRAELDLISAGFDKMPGLSGHGNQAVIVNSGGTGLTLTTGTLALGGNFTTSGAFATTLTMTAATTLTLPTTGTLSTLAGTESLSNKTLVAPVLSGTVTGTYTLGGTPTLSSPVLSGTVTGTYTLGGTPTLGSQLNLNGQTILNTGTLTFPTSTDTMVGRATTDTLTNKTLSAPVLSGTATGTYTLGGTPTVASPILSGTVTGTYTLGGTPTLSVTVAGTPTFSGAVTFSSTVSGGTFSGGTWNGTAVSATYGGTGLDSHLSSGIPSLNSGTWSINNVLTANQILYGAASNAVTSSSSLTYDGTSFVVGTAGPHAIGGGVNNSRQLSLTGTYSSGNALSTNAVVALDSTLNVFAGGDGALFYVAGTLQKAASGTHADFASLLIQPPTIGAGAATLTNASTVKITGAPSGATNNYALWAAGGTTRLDGGIIFTTSVNPASGVAAGIFLNGTSLALGAGTAGFQFINFSGSTILATLTNAGILGLGTTVTTGASGGDLGLSHAGTYRILNNAGSSQVAAVALNASDQVVLGSSAHVVPTGTADTIALLNATQTLAAKTLSSPTLSGTVAGTPTWASAQTMPGLTLSSTALAVGSGGLGITTTPSNGYIPIGNGTNYTAAALTAGNGVTISNGAGSVTLNSQCTYGSRHNTSANNATTPLTRFDLTADAVILRDSSNTCIVRWNPGTLTNDTGVAGSTANGRDQAAAFTASSWLHFYWIWNGSTLATLSSATAPPTGPTLPTGYTHWSYAGAVYFDASSHLLSVHGRGSMVFYDAHQSVLSGGSATVETSVSVATQVPPNATAYELQGYGTIAPSSGQSATFTVRVVSGAEALIAYVGSPGTNAIAHGATIGGMIPNLSQNFYYLWNNSATSESLNLWVVGYELPNGGT